MVNQAKFAEAKKRAESNRQVPTVDEALTPGQMVLLDGHSSLPAVVLEVKFNRIPWMHSYTVSTEEGDILEVMEWAVTAI